MVQRQGTGHDLKAKEFGQESAEVNKSRAIAQKIWVLAHEADQLAQDYQNQSPHNAHNHHRTKDLALGPSLFR